MHTNTNERLAHEDAKPNKTAGLIPAYCVVISLGHAFPLILLLRQDMCE